jgi:hypothetical protein
MIRTKYFTKVRQQERPPLTHTLERFLANVELVVVKDVRFALTGEETPHPAALDKPKTESK